MYHDRLNKTICALATSSGSTIGIIRISGDSALFIAEKLSGVKNLAHMQARLVHLFSENSVVVEKCILLFFKAPRSYTGEDVVEFHLHGSSLNALEVLSLVFKLGAIPALKGEFTFRAVLNSKMSLSEAFALNTLITSSNHFSVELARKESFENNSTALLRSFLAEWEKYYIVSTAFIDFPDQVSGTLPYEKLLTSIHNLKNCLEKIVSDTVSFNKTVNFSALILGKPNVGKSSLFNLLLKKQRAITSDIPGTTRDYLSETLYIKGFPIKLIDSAGIHDSVSEIENQGILKTKQLIESSDLVILVLDSTSSLDGNDDNLLQSTSEKFSIIVENKTDLSSRVFNFDNSVKISCLNGTGLSELTDRIESHINSVKPSLESIVFFNDWQLLTANKILTSLEDLSLLLQSDQIELIHFNIKDVFYNIRNLSGEISAFDIYDKIFDSFCLGK